MVSDAEPAREMLPLAAPAPFGVKVTVMEAVCPGPRDFGRARPLKTYAALLAEAVEIVTVDSPGLVMFTDCVWGLPMFTFPKVTDAGLADIEPAFTALADTAICSCASPAVLVISEIFPDGLPVAFGV